MDPVSAVTSTWTIAKTAAEITKRLYEFSKALKDRDAKQHIDEILDELRELKQAASDLEDENRGLREKLRFKGDDFLFRSPFWYSKEHPDLPLCPKCFAGNIAAPMGEPGQGVGTAYRQCLVCDHGIEVDFARSRQVQAGGRLNDPNGWMR